MSSGSNLHREQLDTLFNQQNVITNTTNSHNFKVGMDYFANKKVTLGVILSGTLSDNIPPRPIAVLRSPIYQVEWSAGSW